MAQLQHPLLSLVDQPASSSQEPDWAQWRAPLADDDQVLQSHAHYWLRRIPSGLHPKQLCRYYPRIANRIATRWDDARAVGRLLTELMVDRRGGRRGFPPPVAADIVRLHRLHAKRLVVVGVRQNHVAAA